MITINLNKAKSIAHEIRRTKRASEFAPLDVQVTIPSKAAEAEFSRQAIREKYAAIQADIESAPGIDELKMIADLLN